MEYKPKALLEALEMQADCQERHGIFAEDIYQQADRLSADEIHRAFRVRCPDHVSRSGSRVV